LYDIYKINTIFTNTARLLTLRSLAYQILNMGSILSYMSETKICTQKIFSNPKTTILHIYDDHVDLQFSDKEAIIMRYSNDIKEELKTFFEDKQKTNENFYIYYYGTTIYGAGTGNFTSISSYSLTPSTFGYIVSD
jgi:hypothetical protein